MHYEILEIASQLPVDEVVTALDELEKQDILCSSDLTIQNGLVYRFRQNIFRDIILLEMSVTRKRLLHRRLAAAMENKALGNIEFHTTILAEHYEASGDLEHAFRLWVKTAQHARRVSAPADAYTAYSRADSLVASIDIQLTDEELANFYKEWADIAYLTGDCHTLNKIHERLMTSGERRSSPLLLGNGLYTHAIALFSTNHFIEGLATIDQALRYFRECENQAEWLKCMARKSKFLYMSSRFKDARQVIEQALTEVPEKMDDAIRDSQAGLYYDYATVLTLMGYPNQGVIEAEKSLHLYMQAHNMEGQAKGYAILILANGFCGETVRAETEGRMGLELANRIYYGRMQGYIYVYLAMVNVCRGRMDDAWSNIQKALNIGEKYGYNEIVALAIRTTGDIFRYLGNDAQAIRCYQQAYETSGNSFTRYDCLSRLGYVHCLTGNLDFGMEMITAAQIAAEQMDFGSVAISTKLYRFLIQKDQSTLGASQEELNQIMLESKSRGLMAQWGVALGLLARLDYFNGHPEQAEEKINLLVTEGQQFEGVWASMLIQILHDKGNSTNDMLYKRWQMIVSDFLDKMDTNCKNPEIRVSYENYKNLIDKMVP